MVIHRLALFSDLHGNDVAFAAVLDDIARAGVDQMICLGDAIQGGPQPKQIIERLRAIDCRIVLGNADALLLDLPHDGSEELTDYLLEVREWTLEQLDHLDLAFIRGFERVVTVHMAGNELVCFHGSPRSFNDILYPGYEHASLDPFLHVGTPDLMAGGHTHRQWTGKIGDTLFVNPGTVGSSPHLGTAPWPTVAEYALVFVDDEVGMSILFRHVPYALSAIEHVMYASGRPQPERGISMWRGPDWLAEKQARDALR